MLYFPLVLILLLIEVVCPTLNTSLLRVVHPFLDTLLIRVVYPYLDVITLKELYAFFYIIFLQQVDLINEDESGVVNILVTLNCDSKRIIVSNYSIY